MFAARDGTAVITLCPDIKNIQHTVQADVRLKYCATTCNMCRQELNQLKLLKPVLSLNYNQRWIILKLVLVLCNGLAVGWTV